MIRCYRCRMATVPCDSCVREMLYPGGQPVWADLYGYHRLPEFKRNDMLDALRYGSYSDNFRYAEPDLSKEPGQMKSLVLNDQMAVQIPKSHGWPKAEAPHPHASFDEPKAAQEFAQYLAGKYRDQSFHVFQAVGTAKTEAPPVKWVKASPSPKRTKPAV